MENLSNKVQLIGFVGSDAEMKSLSGNQRVARVNIAVNENYRNAAGEEVKKTNWFSLTFWNTKADEAEEKVKKGAQISVEGRLQSGSYEAKDGIKRFTTDIVVTEFSVIKSTQTAE